jgi:heat shock protein HslJ
MKIVFAAFIGWFTLAMNHIPLNNNPHHTIEKRVVNYDVPLLNTHWRLIELSNKKIPDNATQKEMFMVLNNNSTLTGNGGCNSFSGNYSLGKDNEISFGNIVRTNILCPGIDYESKYLNALAKVDHYSLIGDTLSLQRQFISVAKLVAEK